MKQTIQLLRFLPKKTTPFFTSMILLILMLASPLLQAQIQGKITDASTQEPIPGANVVLKGKNTGTITDFEGSFNIQAAQGDTLVFSFLGFLPAEQVITGNFMTVSLENNSQSLDELTVTALGISREKKSLGYSVAEIGGETLTQARETNLMAALSGKVAGVQIVGNPSGIGSSSRVTIRGERSLNINNNEPLFVVDGVPVSNQSFGSAGGPKGNNQDVDYGDGAGFINPDDIESITILKGPSAAALYGSRSNNGVIMITTKTGKGTKGLGISINSTLTFESPLRLPEYQNVYGQGLNGEFGFKDGNGGGLRDGVDENWGPAMNGQLLEQFDGQTANGFRGGDVGNLFTAIGPVDLARQLDARGAIDATPFIAYPDNIRDFFETGATYSNNIALQGSNATSHFRLSYTNVDQKGFVPNTDLKRNTISFAGEQQIAPWFSAAINAHYLNNTSGNRPNLSYGTENIMYLFNCWLPRSVNLESMRNYWQSGREGLNQFGFNYNYHDNPYFNLFENTNGQSINRVYGNVALTFDITKDLSLQFRTGTDFSDEFRDRRRAYSTQRYLLGSYREEKIRFEERNTDVLLSYNTTLTQDLDWSVSLGGNQMRQKRNQSDISAPELAVPGVYSLNNSRVALQSSTFRSERHINSLYATTQFGFRDLLYLDLSGRNDWSSTLPDGNNSYFYYATNVSIILSELFKIGTSSPLSFAKLRFGVAQVGNDTDAYQLLATYNAQQAVLGSPAYSESAILPNADLKPEISSPVEAGLDLRFLNNRLGLDVTYYSTTSKNQIIAVPLSNTTGYTARLINAGEIQNKGVELVLHASPFRSAKGLNWDIDLNWSTNRGKVISLYTDPVSGQEITNFVMASRYVTVEARKGERMGDMYAIIYERVSSDPNAKYYDPTGEFVGQIVYNDAGKPIGTTTRQNVGNYNPDWQAGLYNTFSYKGLSLGFLFDFRFGGKVYSHTQTVGREGGTIIETLEGRPNGYDLSLPENGVIGEGVVPVLDGDGNIVGYTPNTEKLSSREWHTTITLGRSLLEEMIFDATFLKLREVRLGYTLPDAWVSKLKLRDITISLVGRNLALWTDVPHIDPESASTSGGTIIPGVESVALPSTRSFGVNLGLKF
jgi:TonB-linked SusC/RagA family outer membrane protein